MIDEDKKYIFIWNGIGKEGNQYHLMNGTHKESIFSLRGYKARYPADVYRTLMSDKWLFCTQSGHTCIPFEFASSEAINSMREHEIDYVYRTLEPN